MDTATSSNLGADHASGITSTVCWIPDLDPARRRALGEAVVALRLTRPEYCPGETNVALAGTLEEPNAQTL